MIRNRLSKLREYMNREHIDYVCIPTSDNHSSEYVSDYFKVREYFSGFTGSNGTLLVLQQSAYLWTDGRYFIQAERELAGSGITLMRMAVEGVPTLFEFLESHLSEGQRFAMNGFLLPVETGEKYKALCEARQAAFVVNVDVAETLWEDRPAFPGSQFYLIPEALCGQTVEEKLKAVRKALLENGCDSLFLSKLDDIAWLLNIRANDVECNPVGMAYVFLNMEQVYLFAGAGTIKDEAAEHLSNYGITVLPYESVEEFLASSELENKKIAMDFSSVNYRCYKCCLNEKSIKHVKNPTELLKACKNPVELANIKQIYLQDSVAVTKFIYWVKKAVREAAIQGARLTEVDAANYLDHLRSEIPGFIELSFPTIAGYGANAAMMHYEATEENCAALSPEGFLLVDSGGQYMGGTTDVTRTIALGPLSDSMKKHYTLALCGMLELTHGKWLHGCTGRNLDILARRPLWEIGMDYRCGTGHGIGYILNVHEGPQNIRWKFNPGQQEAVLEEGMIVSNEPGVYIENEYGIRIENILAVKKLEENEYGQFLGFDTLTLVPIEMEAVDEALMNDTQKKYLREYQELVKNAISPYLSEEEKAWLQSL